MELWCRRGDDRVSQGRSADLVADELPELMVDDAIAWRGWLDQHHADSTGVWLVLAKKGNTTPTTLSYAQALDEALCQGWIDGQVQRRDEFTYRHRFTPRRNRSRWSPSNIGNVSRLTEEGRMQPSGLATVARARADGSWEGAAISGSAREVRVGLAAALALAPRAQSTFELLTTQDRDALVSEIAQSRRAEMRARRIQDLVNRLARGETSFPRKPGRPG